jgi:glutamyl-tRNA(Gln) amidotransferase subunit E
LSTPDLASIGLKVGFEIHQQLATKTKLFCECSCSETDKYGYAFTRKLRPTQSELGIYDPAAVFEFKKMRTTKYYSAPGSSCLVEADEEPPHEVSKEALESALIFSLALHSRLVDEVHVMRKIVIDGSNTSGFQRTMLVANGGFVEIADKQGIKRVGVQTICLEEDAAKLISDGETAREYGLDRLGVPLVEIALEPISGTPEEMVQVALTLGRLLRASKRVARGLGSIRQDVNVSIQNGPVVEIKGVQQLDQLAKVIEHEAKRQHGLIMIADRIKAAGVSLEQIGDKLEDITDVFSQSDSSMVKKILSDKGAIFKAIRIRGFAGIIGFEPYPGIRLGKELGELVRFYGLGGVFHSDELPGYGIDEKQVKDVRDRLQASSRDAFVIVGGRQEIVEYAIQAIIQRLKAAMAGVPAETRAATSDGRTVFSRPRPGAARMYPETDIPTIPVSESMLEPLYGLVPKSWEQEINLLAAKYGLNRKLAEQVFDSDYLALFEEICFSQKADSKIQPTFVASKLTEDIVSLRRQKLDVSSLTEDMIREIFERLARGVITKESVPLVFEKLMKKEVGSVNDAINALGISVLTDVELDKALDKVIRDNMPAIKQKGMGSIGMLMGRSMAALKGSADGNRVNAMLKEKLEKLLASS